MGAFVKELASHAVAHGLPGAARDLLPVSLEAIQGLTSWPKHIRDWTAFTCAALNFQFCAGFTSKTYMKHSADLSPKQRSLLDDHIRPAIDRMLEGDPKLAPPEEVKSELSRKGHDYDGGTYTVMEELDFEKVISCWPTADQAAVAPLEEFLEGETKRLIQTPMASILPEEEWPERRPKSYVRATDETWAALVKEGFKRGLFQACPDNEVLTDSQGNPVVNGAGAVPKIKGGVMKQRFISIFCPLNAVSRKIEGDESTLPYVGQVTLLNIPEECEVVVDSEDMASAFNLFRMPPGWRGLFVYEKKAPGRCLGLDDDTPTYVALRTVPMGWLSAVGAVQAAIRHLAFKVAGLPQQAELQKWQAIPKDEKLLLYLDSVDQLRLVSRTMAKVCEGEPSEEHKRFSEACRLKGLPTNAAKMLAGSLTGSLQGGELRSRDGTFGLQPEKLRMNIAMILRLLSLEEWNHRETSGVVGRLVFAAAFRGPLLSTLQDTFHLFSSPGEKKRPTRKILDELACMGALLPFAFTNVRAYIYPKISCTDASPTGAGSCISTQLKRPAGIPNPDFLICDNCRGDISEEIGNGSDIECPLQCGVRFCSLQCFLEHHPRCPNQDKPVPLFSERWSGPNCPLSQAVLQEGLPVAAPYDIKFDPRMDFFTEEGKGIWQDLDDLEADAEHHAPDCKTMSRARGRPFWIGNEWHRGPPAIRSEQHVMGFTNLKGPIAVKVRQSNKMALRSIMYGKNPPYEM